MSEYILEMRDIVKEFPGVKALNHVNLKVKTLSLIHIYRADCEALRQSDAYPQRFPRQ